MPIRIYRSSGNVFLDVGFPRPEAERLLIRSDLMIQVADLIKKRRLTQARAAKLMGVTQPRISDLVRGRIELFSIDTLVDMLARLGVSVSIVTKPRRGGHRVA
ncbi:MAG TPA: helix-turn-helix transcriptional regulator [Gemmatimonadaceae bacterium]|jgi:predicted XRE-type DNA-binding protein